MDLAPDPGRDACRFHHSFPLLRWVQHLALLAGLPWYFCACQGDFFVGCLFCLAASNVPLQLQWFMRAARIRGPLFWGNQVILMASFGVLRLVFLPTLAWRFGCEALVSLLSTRGWPCGAWQERWVCLGAALALLGANAVWLAVMIRTSRVEFHLRNQPGYRLGSPKKGQ